MTTTVNDIVLIYLEDAPVSFARIESILPDAKKDWYHIKLLMLQVPLQVVTWILKDDYINGEKFNMNGKPMRLEKVECPVQDIPAAEFKQSSSKEKGGKPEIKKKDKAQIISFDDLKRNNGPEAG